MVFENVSESMNRWVWVFEKKNQAQRTISFLVFKKLERTARFHERTGKDPRSLGRYLLIFNK
jgi:hypothetical protein